MISRLKEASRRKKRVERGSPQKNSACETNPETGSALASHFDQWADPVLHAKLELVALAAGLVVWHSHRPSLRALEGVIFFVSLVVIVWLGLMLAR